LARKGGNLDLKKGLSKYSRLLTTKYFQEGAEEVLNQALLKKIQKPFGTRLKKKKRGGWGQLTTRKGAT